MKHRLEILNKRDRYMIGDWVLVNGKPYQWTAADYNRTQKGMEEVEDMRLTKEIMFLNGYEKIGINGILRHKKDGDHVSYSIERFEGKDWIVGEWAAYGIVGIKHVWEWQHYLHLVGYDERAEAFVVEEPADAPLGTGKEVGV